MRLTKDVIQKILDMNEGHRESTFYKSRNFTEEIQYLIQGGQLLMRRAGKTSWADSHFDNCHVADIEQTRRFIRKFFLSLNTDGLD